MLQLVAVVTLFATWFTLHVWLSASLLRDNPRWRAGLALLVPPLAPIWGWLGGRKRRAIAWSLAALAYGVALLIAVLR